MRLEWRVAGAAGAVGAPTYLVELREEVVDRLGKGVDFVLELLHVAVRLVVLAGVLLVAPVELVVELHVSGSDLRIDSLQDQVRVLTFADLAENVALELEHGLLDDAIVEIDHVRGDLRLELRVLVHDRLQLLFANTISIYMMESFVEELALVAKEVFITANDGLLSKLDMEIPFVLVRESDTVLARFVFRVLLGLLRDDVDLLIDLVILLKNVLLG